MLIISPACLKLLIGSGKLCIEVTQRIPILRVMSANGENYYLDNKGTCLLYTSRCV